MALNEQQLGDLGVSIHAGFPNAAVGSHTQSLSLDQLLIRHPATTFLMRLDNDMWTDYGMSSDDILIVDRSAQPQPADIVVWVDAEAFTLSYFREVPLDTPIWGTITASIRQHKYRNVPL